MYIIAVKEFGMILKKKLLLIIIGIFMSVGAFAQEMRELWINLPDSIVPYLTKNQRTELVDYVNMRTIPVVQNQLGDSTRINRLSENYLNVTLNETTSLELKRLDANTLVLVKTWMGPSPDSKIMGFDIHWNNKPLTIMVDEKLEKPDTINADKFQEMLELMKPRVKQFMLSPDDNTMTLVYHYPLVTKKDEERLQSLVKPIVLTWNGNNFQKEK